jgi:hypothetical protein
MSSLIARKTLIILRMKKLQFFLIALTIISCKDSLHEISESMSTNKLIKLTFDNNEQLYFKTNSHGISGNHQSIVLSNQTKTVYEKESDYIFYSSEIYYRTNKDSIIIYAPESGVVIPKDKSFKTIVSVIRLKNYDEIADYEKNYNAYKLQKLSVYSE